MRLPPHIVYWGGVGLCVGRMNDASSTTREAAPMSSVGLKDLADLSSYMNLELFTKC